jgi:hypothetical protein
MKPPALTRRQRIAQSGKGVTRRRAERENKGSHAPTEHKESG